MRTKTRAQGLLKGAMRITLLAVGILSVVLAVLGIFIPVLPTTPFLLLAAFCFARTSDRFYSWLLSNRWFGEYIRNYREGRGIPLIQKALTLIFLWATIGYAAWVVVSPTWGKVGLLTIGVGVTTHILWVKTSARRSSDAESKDAINSPEDSL